ncbi:Quinol monooxygenase YgiN [Propionispora hippei DSM 15287]|uniref:Quinol monooxygenase YgiN n=2 Tax=Propionispora TaxID=112902 RepID=A0A1M6IZP9_9FIRM|nr:Quinol monooxygenase YgiN [Propionispora hippei DSM 15287]
MCEAMVIVIARLKVRAGKKSELFKLAQHILAETRQEEGCISYELMDDPYSEEDCAFVERWADRAALTRHMQTPHFSDWRQKSADYLTGPSAVSLYQAEAMGL